MVSNKPSSDDMTYDNTIWTFSWLLGLMWFLTCHDLRAESNCYLSCYILSHDSISASYYIELCHIPGVLITFTTVDLRVLIDESRGLRVLPDVVVAVDVTADA